MRPLYVALAVADTVLAATGRTRVLKPVLMPVLALDAEPATRRALLLGGAGDTALLRTGDTAFRLGLGSFLAGHAAWVAALRGRGGGLLRRRPLLALPYAAVLVGASVLLWPRAGDERVPVLVYGAALTATALAALDTRDARAAAGGVLFLASDGLLAAERYAGVEGVEGWVMATYTAGQALLAAGGTSRAPR